MKKSKWLSVLICMSFVAVLFLPGFVKNVQGQAEEPKMEKKSGETPAAKERFVEEKTEFKAKAKARLDELDKKIKELETELKKGGSKMKAETKEGLQDLKKKRAALKKEIEKLKATSKTKWEEAKQKVEAAGDELEEAYNKVRDKLKSE